MGIFHKRHDVTDIYGVKSEAYKNLRLPDTPIKKTFNRHYHNYFRGFTEVRTEDRKGRIKIERFYTKPWIVSGLSKKKYWMLRILYMILAFISISLYLLAMSRDVPGNYHWVVALPGMPAAIILFLMAVVVVQYVAVPRKMTLWEHESSTKNIKRASLASACIVALTGLAMIGFVAVNGEELFKSILCILMNFVSSCCSAAIFILEKKVPYHEIANDTVLPEGEKHEIR